MSIPGLGQLASTQPAPSAIRTVNLQPFWEWRFEVPHGSAGITLRLIQGTAERDGTELAPNQPYKLAGTKSKILTWHGATLEVEGVCEEYVAEHAGPNETPEVSYLNMHFALQDRRERAARSERGGGQGPRLLVCGPPNSGKTTLSRTLVALASKQGAQPVLVSTDPANGMLSLPGTLSAAVFASLMDLESPEGGIGVGGTPSSGPSAVPSKLPLVYYCGKEKPEEDLDLWKELIGCLGRAASARAAEDEDVGNSGMIIDTPPIAVGHGGTDILAHIVKEFGVDIVVVIGSPRMNVDLQRKLAQERTKSGEPITFVLLDKSSGVAERDEHFMQLSREAAIKEYFFGDAKRTLSPFTQSLGAKDMVVYTAPDPSDYLETQPLIPVDASVDMSNCVLAVINASLNDSPKQIRRAPVMGFVYIADIDSERQRLKVLAPVSARWGDRPLVWGKWPEPFISLLG